MLTLESAKIESLGIFHISVGIDKAANLKLILEIAKQLTWNL